MNARIRFSLFESYSNSHGKCILTGCWWDPHSLHTPLPHLLLSFVCICREIEPDSKPDEPTTHLSIIIHSLIVVRYPRLRGLRRLHQFQWWRRLKLRRWRKWPRRLVGLVCRNVSHSNLGQVQFVELWAIGTVLASQPHRGTRDVGHNVYDLVVRFFFIVHYVRHSTRLKN